MPFKDDDERRRYDRDRKRRLRAIGTSATTLTPTRRLRVAEDVEALLVEAVRLVYGDTKARM